MSPFTHNSTALDPRLSMKEHYLEVSPKIQRAPVRACVLVSVWAYTCILCFFLYFVRTFVSALACELCGSRVFVHARVAC